MKPISLLTVVPLLGLAAAAVTDARSETEQAVSFGVYDPDGHCPQENRLAFVHVYFSWATYRPRELREKLQAIQANGQRPLITLEPWPDRTITSFPSALLADVLAGKYDQRILQFAQGIASFPGPVLLRWGHEMENVTGRYPWASHNSALFRDAYRHFVTKSRLSARNIRYVWSPAGDRGLERYWPGEGYVDYVGVSVFEFPAFDQAHYRHATRSFHDHMTEKYNRVARYGKPIVIAECGVTGSKAYQLSWLSGALQDLRNYPLLRALIYFNAKDTPGAWGRGYSTPDWRISGCRLPVLFGRTAGYDSRLDKNRR
jgi:cellulose synthase (UDP-forming)